MRSEATLALLKARAGDGVTVKELCADMGVHHGQGSAALSHLHKEGVIARLDERRSRASVYVLPEYVNGRALLAPKARPVVVPADVDLDEIRAEGYAAGRASALADAEEDWALGYAAGKVAGAEDARDKAGRVIDEMIRALGNRPAHRHTRECWKTNPRCALSIARKSLEPRVPVRYH